MLDDLSTRVDSTDNRLQRANKRMTEFIRKNEGKCLFVCLLSCFLGLATNINCTMTPCSLRNRIVMVYSDPHHRSHSAAIICHPDINRAEAVSAQTASKHRCIIWGEGIPSQLKYPCINALSLNRDRREGGRRSKERIGCWKNTTGSLTTPLGLLGWHVSLLGMSNRDSYRDRLRNE